MNNVKSSFFGNYPTLVPVAFCQRDSNSDYDGNDVEGAAINVRWQMHLLGALVHHLGNGPGNSPDDSPNGVQVQRSRHQRGNDREDAESPGHNRAQQRERSDYPNLMDQANLTRRFT